MESARDVVEAPELDGRIARSCLAAERRFCSEVPRSLELLLRQSAAAAAAGTNGHLEKEYDLLFECLVRHKNEPDMERDCRAAVEHFQIISKYALPRAEIL